MLWSAHHSPAQAQLPPAELAQTREEMGGRNTPDHRVCGGSALMSWKACELVWQRGWRCTTSASGSTINSVVPGWPSPTCWDGDLTIHTKRLKEPAAVRGPKQDPKPLPTPHVLPANCEFSK